MKQMARPAMARIEPVGIARQQVLHPSRQIRLGRTEEKVDMVWHADETEDFESELVDRRFEPFQESPIVTFIAEDALPSIPARHGVIDCAWDLNA
jgi:hypothetical protein